VVLLVAAFSVPLVAQLVNTLSPKESIEEVRTRAEAGDAEAQESLGVCMQTAMACPRITRRQSDGTSSQRKRATGRQLLLAERALEPLYGGGRGRMMAWSCDGKQGK